MVPGNPDVPYPQCARKAGASSLTQASCTSVSAGTCMALKCLILSAFKFLSLFIFQEHLLQFQQVDCRRREQRATLNWLKGQLKRPLFCTCRVGGWPKITLNKIRIKFGHPPTSPWGTCKRMHAHSSHANSSGVLYILIPFFKGGIS